MKFRFSLLSVILIMTMLFSCVSVSAAVQLGDANADGKITAIDAILQARYIANWKGYDESIMVLEALDFDGDGRVTPADGGYISRKVAGWEEYSDLSDHNPNYIPVEQSPVAPAQGFSFNISGSWLKTTITPPADTTAISGYELYFYDSSQPASRQHGGVHATEFHSTLGFDVHYKSGYTYDKLDVVSLTKNPNYTNKTVTYDVNISCAGTKTPVVTEAIELDNNFATVKFDNIDNNFVKYEFYEYDGNSYSLLNSNYNDIIDGSMSIYYAGDSSIAEQGRLFIKITGMEATLTSANSVSWSKYTDTYFAVTVKESTGNNGAGQVLDIPITEAYFSKNYDGNIYLQASLEAGYNDNIWVDVYLSQDGDNWVFFDSTLISEFYGELGGIGLGNGTYRYIKFTGTPFNITGEMGEATYNDLILDNISLTINNVCADDISARFIPSPNSSNTLIAGGFPANSYATMIIRDCKSTQMSTCCDANGVWVFDARPDAFDTNGDQPAYIFYTFDSSVETDSKIATMTCTSYGDYKAIESGALTEDTGLVDNVSFAVDNRKLPLSIESSATDVLGFAAFLSADNGATWESVNIDNISVLNLNSDSYNKLKVVGFFANDVVKYCDKAISIATNEFSPELTVELDADNIFEISNLVTGKTYSFVGYKTAHGSAGFPLNVDANGFASTASYGSQSNKTFTEYKVIQVISAEGTDVVINSTGWTPIS